MVIYARNKGTPSTYASYSSQQGFVQKPVTARPLGYVAKGWKSNVVNKFAVTPTAYSVGPTLGAQDLAYATAYDRLTRSIRNGQAAALGITLVQWRQSLDMVATRTRQIASAANDIRKGNVVRALKTLKIVSTRKERTRFRKIHARHPSALWLELQFGWKPLYGDIKTAIDVMSRDIPVERKFGNSRVSFSGSRVVQNTSNVYWDEDWLGVSRWTFGADVVGINPNVYLAANLGLTNPAQVAWDAVPFSFVVDWFVPINKYLSAFDSRIGFTLDNAFHTHSVKAMSQQRFKTIKPVWEAGTKVRVATAWRVQRFLGAGSRPSLSSRIPPVDGSLWRAVTGVTLAVTSLSKLRLNLI
uniref:Maturation protein n=1 Tax=Hubei levi-like virus 3 TaxID=1922915 RepID=A0A1L3KIQ0_9VIRU|nr:hypothetical protein [Hubei levi-like virus 3]